MLIFSPVGAAVAEFNPAQVDAADDSVADTVSSYLFNSQPLSKPDGEMTLMVPRECPENQAVARCLQGLMDRVGPIDELISLTCARVCATAPEDLGDLLAIEIRTALDELLTTSLRLPGPCGF